MSRSQRKKVLNRRRRSIGCFEQLEDRRLLAGFKTGFIELTNLFFSEGTRIFGPGAFITVSGATPPIPTCACQANAGRTANQILGSASDVVQGSIDALAYVVNYEGSGEDQFDFFPSADIYVIQDTGAELAPGAELKDVVGEPNCVIGNGGFGAFVEETIAIASPRGNLPSALFRGGQDGQPGKVARDGRARR